MDERSEDVPDAFSKRAAEEAMTDRFVKEIGEMIQENLDLDAAYRKKCEERDAIVEHLTRLNAEAEALSLKINALRQNVMIKQMNFLSFCQGLPQVDWALEVKDKPKPELQ